MSSLDVKTAAFLFYNYLVGMELASIRSTLPDTAHETACFQQSIHELTLATAHENPSFQRTPRKPLVSEGRLLG